MRSNGTVQRRHGWVRVTDRLPSVCCNAVLAGYRTDRWLYLTLPPIVGWAKGLARAHRKES
ncbi:MAG: hypothetical protein HC769_18245 [Cyanobacteria bacterium CRU_2_1]|nr:hypothetical protein [Cyanobacteria bacterium CRU_2_1]